MLHVVWALLLYRAAGRDGALPVGFGVHLSGRDLPLRGAAGVPGLLGNLLPLTVTVDPAAELVDLLHHARDAVLDLAWYAWVPTELIRSWQGLGDQAAGATTLVRFDADTELPADLRAQLARQDVRLDIPRSSGA